MPEQLVFKISGNRTKVLKILAILKERFFILKMSQIKENHGLAQSGVHVFVDALNVPNFGDGVVQLEAPNDD